MASLAHAVPASAAVGLTMDDCAPWLRPRVQAAFSAALRSLRGAEPAEQGGLTAHRVRIQGLASDLNGLSGWAVRFFADKGRYQTVVDNDAGESVLLRPANLEVAADTEGDSQAQTLCRVFNTLVGAQGALRDRAGQWLDATQAQLVERSRNNSRDFLEKVCVMDDDDRHPGRAAMLGLPTSEQLLDDLAQCEMLVQFYAQFGMTERIVCWWANRTHARAQLAEWYEAEGDFAAAEPLYATIVEQSRAGSPHEAAARRQQSRASPEVERCAYLNNYALCLKRQRKYADAVVLYREAVAIPGAPHKPNPNPHLSPNPNQDPTPTPTPKPNPAPNPNPNANPKPNPNP